MDDEGFLSEACEKLPSLAHSIKQFKEGLIKYEQGDYLGIDMDWDELNSDINVAEVEGVITANEAWILREKYLGMERV